ncbi:MULTISPECIES: permease-like cell division protein FtsX [Halomonadaceae]|uniref:Cell division protein FtsX n=1 Tax=Vreelandella piezotolerans TaxID=2609667 RepID=A0ABQ6X7R3_9GAMM|nr:MULTISPECIES: permease-like cell division protein FtsX [Halomonas]KAE8438039.1 FtsX-like permease family protein [Halomonas piezotolerans]MCG7575895.1 permease-like cell division protein FtsX [Halomonas sp. MMH1-48]MCG7589877.1 permease-like cell division protein FtsX [Halomonas sp. McD50-5]MCG7602957.1 permease-like cell division protein FtsX [Halomonas sp. MM17-34]MCG7612004.1 permease-like cell division protein FtsX [Halomonas sp. MM17-29]
MKRSATPRQSGAAPRAARAPAKPHAPVTEKTPRGGARSQQTRMGSRLRAWGRHHRAMALDSLFRLVRYPLGNLLTMLAIAIALVLPAALWLTLDSAKLLDAELDESASLTVYLDMGIDAAQAARIEEAVSADGGVAQTRMISPEQGMADFQQSLGIDDTLAGLDDNPLPASIVISPQDVEPAAMAELAERLEGVTGIDEVRVDLAWVERLRHLAALGRRVALALGVLFGFGVLLVVGNTIRLSVESRRREIEVVMLIGATHAFVRRPFLYSGAWYGAGGGLLALGLLALGNHWLSLPVAALAASYGASFTLPQLDVTGSTILLSCSTLLGWLGAWLAVTRHLSSIRPR